MLGKELLGEVTAEMKEAQKEAAKRVLKQSTLRIVAIENSLVKASVEHNRLLSLSVPELEEMDKKSEAYTISLGGLTTSNPH